MRIRTRLCMSLDGYVIASNGWPAQLADPDFSPEAYGFTEFQQSIDAVLMGRATFEPALGAAAWPWPGLDVYVLGAHRPAGTPERVTVDHDPERLLDRMRADHPDGDVHLVGGPRTIAAFRDLDALDRLGLIVLPRLLGGGTALTRPWLSTPGWRWPGTDPCPTGRSSSSTTWSAEMPPPVSRWRRDAQRGAVRTGVARRVRRRPR
jgi:dihydrofolate reductase